MVSLMNFNISTTICGIIRRLRLFVPDFSVSYRIRSAIKTNAQRTAPHLEIHSGYRYSE